MSPEPQPAAVPADYSLERTLRRLPAATRAATHAYRETGRPEQLEAVISGIIGYYSANGARLALPKENDHLRLVEELAIDSLTMLEIVFLAEDILQITLETEELRTLRTVADVKRLVRSKVRFPRQIATEGLGFGGAVASLPSP